MQQNSSFKNFLKSKDNLVLLVIVVMLCVPILASYNPATQLDIIKNQGEHTNYHTPQPNNLFHF